MNFQIIAVETLGGSQEHIVITRADGSLESFPVDESNPRYLQFLAEQESK